MSSPKYRTAPDHEFTGWPKGIKYIIGNEGCERFSFYGMKSILYSYLALLYCVETVRERAVELNCRVLEDENLATSLSAANNALLETAKDDATATVHFFITGVYALPMVGAIIADRLWGKYNTILWLSIVYCMGHAALAIFESDLNGIYLGLALIAIGSGGIKPCVSAHVGDQFGRGNWGKVTKVFQAFYFIINFGSFFSTLLIPVVKETLGWSVAFAIPGILMAIATVVFWMGRKVFVHVPPRPGGRLGALDAVSSILLFLVPGSLFLTAGMEWYVIVGVSGACLVLSLILFAIRQRIQPDDGFMAVIFYILRVKMTGKEGKPLAQEGPYRDADKPPPEMPEDERRLFEHRWFGPAVRRYGMESAEGPVAVLKIVSIFLLVSFFWSLFDQHSSSWIRQAGMMDREVMGMELLKEQIAATNPIMVMMLIPFTSFVLYPGIEKLGLKLTPLRKMTIGMFITSLSFVAVALIQTQIDAGNRVNVLWQLVPYLIITLAEVMVSITGLEFAYTQAPRRMKSTIMGFWLMTVALGNVFTGLLAKFGGLSLVDFFWVFAALMAGAALLFALRASFYTYKDFTQ